MQCITMFSATIKRFLSALLACLATVASAAAQPPDQQRPNVLFLLSDDQRPDTIAALGNSIIKTPHLDRLVHGGTSFTRAVCANPICTPSRAEILTGCSSFTNGVLDFGGPINPQLVRWAQAMSQAGYRTGYVGKWHNSGRPSDHGYQETPGLYSGGGGKWAEGQVDWKGRPITGYRGWVFQTDDGQKFPEQGVGLTADISARFADAAIEFLQAKAEKPFLLHVNFTAPHDPLIMPPGYAGRYRPEQIKLPDNYLPRHPFDHGNYRGRDEVLLPWPRTPEDVREELVYYYAVISHLDEQIGRVLDVLEKTGQAENTIVVFAGDHGLGMGSHGLRGKQSMYEHTIGVPLIFRGPGIQADVRSDAQIYLRDIYPTICELAGIEIPKTVEARSAAAVLRGEQQSLHQYVFGYFRNFQRMIRGDRYKLVHYPQVDRWQLFDLADDPHELRDLSAASAQAERIAELRDKLATWQKQVRDPVLSDE